MYVARTSGQIATELDTHWCVQMNVRGNAVDENCFCMVDTQGATDLHRRPVLNTVNVIELDRGIQIHRRVTVRPHVYIENNLSIYVQRAIRKWRDTFGSFVQYIYRLASNWCEIPASHIQHIHKPLG